MITATYMATTCSYNFRPEFLEGNEGAGTVGIDAIDAPLSIAAGSCKSYEYISMPGKFTPMPTTTSRER
jgi:hypothetical protein